MGFISNIRTIALAGVVSLGATWANATVIAALDVEGEVDFALDATTLDPVGILGFVSSYTLSFDPTVDTADVANYEVNGSLTFDGDTISESILLPDTSLDALIAEFIMFVGGLPAGVIDAAEDALDVIAADDPASIVSPVELASSGIFFGFDNLSGPDLGPGPLGPEVTGSFLFYIGDSASPIPTFDPIAFSASLSVSQVPLPAGLPLAAAGLGIFGLMSRRRKAA